MSDGPVNSRHGLLLELEQLLARTARGDVADASADILNLMNKAYAEGYRDHEASKHELEVTGTQIRNGAGELVDYFADPPYTVDQAVAEIRARWAASRATTEPHYVVGLPHDFVDKLKARMDFLSDDHGVSTGIAEALGVVVDQLDAWTEWDAQGGLR